nr:hypothetical protein [Nitrosopumilaceae archaeon]NIU88858.1 hypothetical protein [Nitrosopumilaceae archaeon]NIV66982.1 hypothetical protein [Nitrosopumilaceae archaeon]NIX63002.1 hypothetical protein [Nitrosopumilaceae archaeon]
IVAEVNDEIWAVSCFIAGSPKTWPESIHLTEQTALDKARSYLQEELDKNGLIDTICLDRFEWTPDNWFWTVYAGKTKLVCKIRRFFVKE